jgi:hypothetical protein
MDGSRTVVALTGVYHANGSLRGELAYALGKVARRTHCALCDVTHGTVREKPGWRAARATLPVPFEAVHLDERTPEVAAASAGWTPCVVAHTADGAVHRLLGPDALESAQGSPDALVAALRDAVPAAGLAWPQPAG